MRHNTRLLCWKQDDSLPLLYGVRHIVEHMCQGWSECGNAEQIGTFWVHSARFAPIWKNVVPWGGTMHHIHPRTTPTNTSDRSVCRFGDMCKSARCPWYHPTASGTTRQPQRDAGSDMLPPRRRTPAAMSVPAEKGRARNWEERKQQSNWAQGRPTHGSKTSPNRTHNNTQGDHEVRAL